MGCEAAPANPGRSVWLPGDPTAIREPANTANKVERARKGRFIFVVLQETKLKTVEFDDRHLVESSAEGLVLGDRRSHLEFPSPSSTLPLHTVSEDEEWDY